MCSSEYIVCMRNYLTVDHQPGMAFMAHLTLSLVDYLKLPLIVAQAIAEHSERLDASVALLSVLKDDCVVRTAFHARRRTCFCFDAKFALLYRTIVRC